MVPALFICLCLFLAVALPLIASESAPSRTDASDQLRWLSEIPSDLDASNALANPPDSLTSFATMSLSEWDSDSGSSSID